MNTAAHLRNKGIPVRPESILSIVTDAHSVHCLTEAHLDTWWASLAPELKAEIYEAALGPAVESCAYCGCTEQRACPDGCGWFDANHTVCTSNACVQRFLAENPPELDDQWHARAEGTVSRIFEQVARLVPKARSSHASL